MVSNRFAIALWFVLSLSILSPFSTATAAGTGSSAVSSGQTPASPAVPPVSNVPTPPSATGASTVSPLQEIQRLVNANELDQALGECQKFLALNPPEADTQVIPFFKYALKQRLYLWQKHLATGIEQEKDCVQMEENLDVLFKMLCSEEIATLSGPEWSRDDLAGSLGELLDLSASNLIKRIKYMRRNPLTSSKTKASDLQFMAINLAEHHKYHTQQGFTRRPQVAFALVQAKAYLGTAANEITAALITLKEDGAQNLAFLADVDDFEKQWKNGELPSIEEGATGKSLVNSMKGLFSLSSLGSYLDDAIRWFKSNDDLLVPLLWLIGIFWGIPLVLMRIHVFRGASSSVYYANQVKYWGLLAYLQFWMAQWGYQRSAQKPTSTWGGLVDAPGIRTSLPDPEATLPLPGLKSAPPQLPFWKRWFRFGRVEAPRSTQFCSICRRPTDILENYLSTLRFDACPHCGVAIEPIFNFEDYLNSLVHQLVQLNLIPAAKRAKSQKNGNHAELQLIGRFLDSLFAMAGQRNASDIHFERNDTEASIQMRVDGMLTPPLVIPPIAAPAILSSIKVMASLDITNHTTPQDGRLQRKISGIEYDIRINCAPTQQGELLFIRLLDKRRILVPPVEIGFEGDNLHYFEQAIRKPHGLILVTGPTGSGKTTTLYVALNQINNGQRNIVTIEDPVEYQVPGLKQMQVNVERDFTFATGLRSIVRQDPDVVLVGEIRDPETAKMATEAAGTGHLVFTTLHTLDTASAVSRLAELGVAPKRYTSVLELILAQRLIRLICRKCKKDDNPTDALLYQLGILKYRDQIQFKTGEGCHFCRSTGYHGRRAIFEIMKMNDPMRALLEAETQTLAIRKRAHQAGMRFLREEALRQVQQGVTSLEEAARVVS
ncbi:MAG TPA: GspE/PulE family protein [Candidatus Sumerlaeota bacterium]|nr:GspE/PulE family protein [Candidatus Sumerlaeota bacterium]